MKIPNTTDNFFKEKLGDYASEVPAGLWDAIDQARPQKKRGLLLLQRKSKWVAMLLLLLLAGGGYLFMAHGSRLTAHGGAEGDESLGILKSDFDVVNGADLAEKADKNVEKNAMNAVFAEDSNILKSENTSSEKIIEKTKNTPAFKQNTHQKNEEILSKKSPDKIQENIDDNLENLFVNNSISTTYDKPTSSDLINLSAEKLSKNNLLNALEFPVLSKLETKKSDPCYAFNSYDSGKKGPPRLYFDVLGGPSYTQRTLEAKNADLSQYAEIRDSTETSRLGFSSTVRLSLVLANGIALRSGIAYTQINEKLDLFDGSETRIEIYEIKDMNGNVIDTQLDTIYGQRIKTTYNQFKMVDIPLILGYEVHDRNWTVSLNGGAFLNVLFKQKGSFLNPDLQAVNFSPDAEPRYDAFQKTVGMSLFGSVGVNYKIGNRLHLTAEPHFRYFMDSFTNNDYPLQQNYWAVGMNVGMRVQLF